MSSIWHRALSADQVALEGIADGKVRRENEHMWAAEMILEGTHTRLSGPSIFLAFGDLDAPLIVVLP